ncbi:LOW QUALITY PROTEIN: Myb_DNA-bind_3 domain-containing protein, partial [Cephalotus follicularis]
NVFLGLSQMEDALINVLLNEQIKGNKVDGNFTTTYSNAVKELCAQVDKGFNSNITKDKLKNRLKRIKTNFNKSYDLCKNLSGFALSPVTKMWSAEPEFWKGLIDVKNHDAKKWMTTRVGNYDQLLELFAKDRATGATAKTAKEKRQRWANPSLGDGMDAIDGIDHLVSNEVTLESFEETHDNIQQLLSPGMPSRSTSQTIVSSRGKKRKSSNDDEYEAEIFKEGMMDIASALKEGNAILEKSQPHLYSEEELFAVLVDIDVEPQLLTKSYIYLVRNIDMKRAFPCCLFNMRKHVLMEMMFGDE